MGNLIEVEIENKSYIKLQDLDQSSKGTLKLTTLVDNQPGVIIKVFLNKDGERILIKNLEVRHLPPKASGLPRFELSSSYAGKRLYLILKVDGKKVNDSEIKLGAYLRNKYLPLYIIIGIIVALLLIFGARWLIRTIYQPIETYQTTSKEADISRAKPQPLEYATKSVLTETEEDSRAAEPAAEYPTKTESSIAESEKTDPAIGPESVEVTLPSQSDSNQTDKSYKPSDKTIAQTEEQTQPAPPPVSTDISSFIEQVIYFSPNNTTINKDASLLLKELAVKLKKNTNALVEISGHCAMSGTEAGREELSRERAYNIVAYLKEEGWDPETEPVVRWYGGTQPVTSNEEEMYRNRRVEISVKIP